MTSRNTASGRHTPAGDCVAGEEMPVDGVRPCCARAAAVACATRIEDSNSAGTCLLSNTAQVLWRAVPHTRSTARAGAACPEISWGKKRMARHDEAKGTIAMPSASRVGSRPGGASATQAMIALPKSEMQAFFARRVPGRHLPGPCVPFDRRSLETIQHHVKKKTRLQTPRAARRLARVVRL